MPKVSLTPMSDQAYLSVRKSIADGHFPPGTQLVEARLADELGISRGPVREALKRLLQEGLVVHRPYQGTFVREMSAVDVTNIYDVRVALESVAIRQLARQGGPTSDLKSLVDAMDEAARAGRISDLMNLGYSFHRTLCASSGNPLLIEFFDLMSLQARLALEFDTIEYLRKSDTQHFVQAHASLITAIEQGDEHAAAGALAHHILDDLGPLISRLTEEGRDTDLNTLMVLADRTRLVTPG